jgi:hypothetical protein
LFFQVYIHSYKQAKASCSLLSCILIQIVISHSSGIGNFRVIGRSVSSIDSKMLRVGYIQH